MKPTFMKNTSGSVLPPAVERRKAEVWQFTLAALTDQKQKGTVRAAEQEIQPETGPKRRQRGDDPGDGDNSSHQDHKGATSQVDLVTQLIQDLDEVNEVPFFDQFLPLELVVVIFQYLGLTDLVSCSYVSKDWRRAANDDHLWKPLSLRFGWVERRSGATSWKDSCRLWATYFKDLRQRWLERNCRADVLEGRESRIDFTQPQTEQVLLATVAQHSDLILGGYSNGVVKLWDQETCNAGPVHSFNHNVLSEQPQGITAVAVSDSHVFAGTSLGQLWIWSTLRFELVFEYELLAGEILNIHVSSNGQRAVVVSGNKFSVFEYSESAGWQITAEQHAPGPYSKSELIPTAKGDMLVTGSNELFSLPVQVWDVNTSMMRYPLTVILSKLVCADGDSDHLVVGVSDSPDQTVHLGVYSMETGTMLTELGNSWMKATSVRIRDTPNLVIAGSQKGVSNLYDLRKSPYPEMSFFTHSNRVNSVQMDDYKLVTASDDGTCKVQDIRKGNVFWESRDITAVKSARFSERFLVTHSKSSQGGELTSWHSEYVLSRLTVFNFSQGVTATKVNNEYTSTYVVEPSGSAFSVIMSAPYEQL